MVSLSLHVSPLSLHVMALSLHVLLAAHVLGTSTAASVTVSPASPNPSARGTAALSGTSSAAAGASFDAGGGGAAGASCDGDNDGGVLTDPDGAALLSRFMSEEIEIWASAQSAARSFARGIGRGAITCAPPSPARSTLLLAADWAPSSMWLQCATAWLASSEPKTELKTEPKAEPGAWWQQRSGAPSSSKGPTSLLPLSPAPAPAPPPSSAPATSP